MCKAWAMTPFDMGIGLGEGVSRLYSGIPSQAIASCSRAEMCIFELVV